VAESTISATLRAFADIFLPRPCIACGKSVDHTRIPDLCAECEREIALPAGRRCTTCGAVCPEFGTCPNCHNMHLAMNGSAAFGLYRGRLRDAIIDYKFSGRQHLARTFGYLVSSAVKRTWPDVSFDAVAAVPLHRTRRRERGFDQSRAVARYVARYLGVPYRPGILTRVRPTESQVGLTKSARVRNLKGAFVSSGAQGVLTALVVDDIMTTGTTASQACRALKKAGIKRAYSAVVARADFTGDVADRPAAEERGRIDEA